MLQTVPIPAGIGTRSPRRGLFSINSGSNKGYARFEMIYLPFLLFQISIFHKKDNMS